MEMNLPYKTVDGMSAVSWSVNKLVDERANKHVEFGDAILEAFASTILVGSDGETRECVLRKQKQNTPTRSQTRFTCRRRRANGSKLFQSQKHVGLLRVFYEDKQTSETSKTTSTGSRAVATSKSSTGRTTLRALRRGRRLERWQSKDRPGRKGKSQGQGEGQGSHRQYVAEPTNAKHIGPRRGIVITARRTASLLAAVLNLQGSACASGKLTNRQQQESPAPANSQKISGCATGATGEAKYPDVEASLTHRPIRLSPVSNACCALPRSAQQERLQSQPEQSNPAVGGRVVAKASTVVCVGDRQSQVGRRRSHCRNCRTELSAVSASIRNRTKTRTRFAMMPERMSQPQKRNVLHEKGSEELRLHMKKIGVLKLCQKIRMISTTRRCLS